MENIQITGHFPYLAAPIHGRNPNLPDAITERYNRIVDHALDKFLKPHEAHRVRNDFSVHHGQKTLSKPILVS